LKFRDDRRDPSDAFDWLPSLLYQLLVPMPPSSNIIAARAIESKKLCLELDYHTRHVSKRRRLLFKKRSFVAGKIEV
jgi:hypothetical protein